MTRGDSIAQGGTNSGPDKMWRSWQLPKPVTCWDFMEGRDPQ